MKNFLTGSLAMLLLLTTTGWATLSNQNTPDLPAPSVHYGPEEVVKIVVEALANNDKPFSDAGIVTTFSFASPENKTMTGPISRFIRMVKAAPYGDMVNHSSSRFSEVAFDGDDAYQYVQLTTYNGSQVVYGFRLSKQSGGEFKDMWMTDAVWPVSKATSF